MPALRHYCCCGLTTHTLQTSSSPWASLCILHRRLLFHLTKSLDSGSRVGSATLQFPSRFIYKMAAAVPGVPLHMRMSETGRKEEKKGTSFSVLSSILLGNKIIPVNSSATLYFQKPPFIFHLPQLSHIAVFVSVVGREEQWMPYW